MVSDARRFEKGRRMTGEHPDELLESYAFGDCPEPSAARVNAHVSTCARCAELVGRAAEAAGWIAVTHAAAPPAGLRERVLAAARAARPPVTADNAEASEPWARQVAEMGELLSSLSGAQWQAHTAGGGTVRELVLHLAGNDRQVSADLGDPVEPPPGDPAEVWRDGSDRLLRTVSRGDLPLTTPVRLAGKAPVRRPLREALIQRAFETWIHNDDIRAAINLPAVPPAGDHIARIVGFALALLPGAMDAAKRAHPGKAVRLELTGPGGGGHTVPLSARGGEPPGPVAEVRLPAERFGRLLAGRVPVTGRVAEISGHRPAALDLLTVAATLGCD
jgi:uncharacterized protein (TIGR03083 family)